MKRLSRQSSLGHPSPISKFNFIQHNKSQSESPIFCIQKQQSRIKSGKTQTLCNSTTSTEFQSQQPRAFSQKSLHQIELNALLQSTKVAVFDSPSNVLKISPQELRSMINLQSKSLQRSIQKNIESGSIKPIPVGSGIGTFDPYQVPKRSSEYEATKLLNRKRISDHKTISSIGEKFDELCSPFPKEIEEVQQHCKNTNVLEKMTKKYFTNHNHQNQQLAQSLKKGSFNLEDILKQGQKDNTKQEKNPLMRKKIAQHVYQLIKRKDETIYHTKIQKQNQPETFMKIDSKRFEQFNENYFKNKVAKQLWNQKKDYSKQPHKYFKYYSQGANGQIFYPIQPETIEKIENESVDSNDSSQERIKVNEYLNNEDEAEIQYLHYKNNIKNPFIEDKNQMKILKLSGIVKNTFMSQSNQISHRK